MEKERGSRVSLELSRVRENSKLECRQKLKEAYELIKSSLESESRALDENRDELLGRVAKMRSQLVAQEKRLQVLRDSELQALHNRIENENALGELSALQSSLSQEQATESEVVETQEVSVMKEFNAADENNSTANRIKNNLELEREMISNVRIQIKVWEKAIKSDYLSKIAIELFGGFSSTYSFVICIFGLLLNVQGLVFFNNRS